MYNRQSYINEILEYQDILRLQIEKEDHDFNGALSEREMIYNDINQYTDDDFDGWNTNDFVRYIMYLEDITQIQSKLDIRRVIKDDNR